MPIAGRTNSEHYARLLQLKSYDLGRFLAHQRGRSQTEFPGDRKIFRNEPGQRLLLVVVRGEDEHQLHRIHKHAKGGVSKWSRGHRKTPQE